VGAASGHSPPCMTPLFFVETLADLKIEMRCVAVTRDGHHPSEGLCTRLPDYPTPSARLVDYNATLCGFFEESDHRPPETLNMPRP
jgi:hypothetical protein